MKITRLLYGEYFGDDREWIVSEIQFSDVNLIVGKNSTGKSRLLNVIVGLASLIDGQQKILFDSARYDISFEHGHESFNYRLDIDAGCIISETLSCDGDLLFARDFNGEGEILHIKAEQMLDFSVPDSVLVLTAKRDRIQHPYIEHFHRWASRVRFYQFGTSLGREQLAQVPEVVAMLNGESSVDHSRLMDVYSKGFANWGEDYDDAILMDLERLGYPCENVGIDQIDIRGSKGFQLAALFVHEAGLKTPTYQTVMSQGMFRALGMVIHLNYASFLDESRTVIIDDIGEGLDFERACSFVKLLTERCQKHGFQLFMSTNDKFVMNQVDLDHWCILNREGSVVSATTKRSDPDLFEEFEFMGLNNFDLFSSGIFKDHMERDFEEASRIR